MPLGSPLKQSYEIAASPGIQQLRQEFYRTLVLQSNEKYLLNTQAEQKIIQNLFH